MNRDETRRNELKRNKKRNETNLNRFQNENVLSTTTTPSTQLFCFRGTAYNCGSLGLSAEHYKRRLAVAVRTNYFSKQVLIGSQF